MATFAMTASAEVPHLQTVTPEYNALGLRLLLATAKLDDAHNFVLCPIGVATGLTLAYAGANGQTAVELASATSESKSGAVGHLSSLEDQLQVGGSSQSLWVANGMWVEKGIDVLPSYDRSIRPILRDGAMTMTNLGAAATINGWIAARTANQISNVVSDSEGLDKIVLVSAAYFHSSWEVPFDTKRTVVGIFDAADGRRLRVPMMRQYMHVPYFHNDQVTVVRLAFADGRTALYALLPGEGESAEALLSALTAGEWSTFSHSLVTGSGDIVMPRFHVQSSIDLKPGLASLGVRNAFSAGADFSGITGSSLLYIRRFVQGASLQVSETGAAAAAGTAVEFAIKAPNGYPPLIVLNRPFLILLEDSATGAFDFVAIVRDPSI